MPVGTHPARLGLRVPGRLPGVRRSGVDGTPPCCSAYDSPVLLPAALGEPGGDSISHQPCPRITAVTAVPLATPENTVRGRCVQPARPPSEPVCVSGTEAGALF